MRQAVAPLHRNVRYDKILSATAEPARMECFVTVVFAHILVGALASRHMMTANLQQVPLPALSLHVMEVLRHCRL